MSAKVANNTRDSALVDAKVACDLRLLFAILKTDLDETNIIIREFPSKGHDAEARGMQEILGPGNPFKIIDTVIGLDQVDMIDFRQVSWVGNECDRNESMDWNNFHDWLGAKHDDWIPTISDMSTKNSAGNFAQTARFTSTPAVETPDFSEVADFVKVSEFFNRDRSPLFCDSGRTIALISRFTAQRKEN